MVVDRPLQPPGLPDLVGLIYDCVIEPSLWPSALEKMCAGIGGTFGQIGVHDAVTQSVRFAAQWGGDPYWLNLLQSRYETLLPIWGVMHKFEIDRPVNIDLMNEVLDGIDFRDSAFYREFAQPAGYRDVAGVQLMREGGRYSTLSLNTPFSRDPVGEQDLAYVAELAPHVRRAVRISDLIGHTGLHAPDLEAALDALGIAILIVDRETRVLHANEAAREMLVKSSPIAVQQGRLKVSLYEAQKTLGSAIACAAGSEAALGPLGIGIPLRGVDGTLALAHVLPFNRQGVRKPLTSAAVAAIFVTTADEAAQLPASTIAALFGLTPTEGRVMIEIASGRNRNETADVLSMAAGTVKSHLERIFEKTGAASQTELALIVNRLTPPVRA